MGALKGGGQFLMMVWSLIVGIWAWVELANVHPEFKQILKAIPQPEVRIVKDDAFLGPIHVICSPLLISDGTCGDVFAEYEPVTHTQKYFSWLYLDPRSPETNTTTQDILGARSSLFWLFVIGLGTTIFCQGIEGVCRACLDVKEPEGRNQVIVILIKLLGKYSLYVSHMFMCNLFTVSEYSPGVFILEYIPAYAYWWIFGLSILLLCCSFLFVIYVLSSLLDDHDDGTGVVACGCCYCWFVLCIFVLWGISQYGLFVYVWDFNANFEAYNSNSTGILHPDYIGSIDVLKKLSIAFGVQGVVDSILMTIMECI